MHTGPYEPAWVTEERAEAEAKLNGTQASEYVYTYTHEYSHVYVCIYTYIYMHTCIQAHMSRRG